MKRSQWRKSHRCRWRVINLTGCPPWLAASHWCVTSLCSLHIFHFGRSRLYGTAASECLFSTESKTDRRRLQKKKKSKHTSVENLCSFSLSLSRAGCVQASFLLCLHRRPLSNRMWTSSHCKKRELVLSKTLLFMATNVRMVSTVDIVMAVSSSGFISCLIWLSFSVCLFLRREKWLVLFHSELGNFLKVTSGCFARWFKGEAGDMGRVGERSKNCRGCVEDGWRSS